MCLANCRQDTLPDGEERARLQIAGLGEKKIALCSYSDAQDIYHDILHHFPKLLEAEGFDLLWTPEGGGKQLDVVYSCPRVWPYRVLFESCSAPC